MSVKSAVKQSNRIIKGIDKVAAKIKTSSVKIKDNAFNNAIDFNKTKTPFRAYSLVHNTVDSDLRKVINDTNKNFNDFLKETERYLSANFAIKLSQSDLKAIANKSSLLIDNLIDNTDILKSDIQNILTQNLSKGVSEKRLILELQELYPAYARNASTIINTGLSRLFVDINVSKLQDSSFEWFIWAGPDDSITRETPCKHWVWHRFSKSQLSTITATRMTLWNCRHSIIPISNDELDDYPVGDINFS